MLREFESKPCVVLACKIEEGGTLAPVLDDKGEETGKYEYLNKGQGASRTHLTFSASQEPKVGDYIIYGKRGADVYHCPEDVFLLKYKPKGMSIL